MNEKEWLDQIKEWERRYPLPLKQKDVKRVSDLTKVKICCAVCGSSDKKLQRHHKANDFMFAVIRPDLFAARYIEFRRKDIDLLCPDCHDAYHIQVTHLKNTFWIARNYFLRKDYTRNQEMEFLRSWKREFLANYKKWKEKEIKYHARRTK